jgi:hypothetical protein
MRNARTGDSYNAQRMPLTENELQRPNIPVRNSILATLLASQYERLLPKLEHVTLKGGDLISD